jgi:hypothetical protein
MGYTPDPWPIAPATPIFDLNPMVNTLFNSGSVSLVPEVISTPTFVRNGGGIPYVTFGGGAALRYGTGLGVPAEWTVIAVAEATTQNRYLCGNCNSGANNRDQWATIRTTNNSPPNYGSQVGDGTNGVLCITTGTFNFTLNNVYCLTTRYTTGDNFCDMWVNGAKKVTTNTPSPTGTKPVVSTPAGGTWSVGADGAYNSLRWIGDVYRLAVWDRPLSDAERLAFETACARFYPVS